MLQGKSRHQQLEIVILTVLLVQLFKIDEHLKTNTNKA